MWNKNWTVLLVFGKDIAKKYDKRPSMGIGLFWRGAYYVGHLFGALGYMIKGAAFGHVINCSLSN